MMSNTRRCFAVPPPPMTTAAGPEMVGVPTSVPPPAGAGDVVPRVKLLLLLKLRDDLIKCPAHTNSLIHYYLPRQWSEEVYARAREVIREKKVLSKHM